MTSLLVERSGAVARLVLNRPDQGNALDLDLAQALERAASEVATDASIRCVVLTGKDRFFCVGGDAGAIAAAGGRPGQFLRTLVECLGRAIDTLATMPKPLVVAVNGPAAGGGMSLALLGDMVLCAPAAHFTVAYSAIGLTPDCGMSWLLPRLVGLRRAQELAFTNRRVSAQEALEIGLVTRLADAECLEVETNSLAESLSAMATSALGGARALIQSSATNTLRQQLDLEAARIASAGDGAEAAEGIAAFLARRKPQFQRT